ncbi:hypothetical protein CM318V1_1000001 [Carnobacterium maltaromaticum]|nr:hypothetical protein CM318V1_1000001 [Carnobacterium maltaromaticum]
MLVKGWALSTGGIQKVEIGINEERLEKLSMVKIDKMCTMLIHSTIIKFWL